MKLIGKFLETWRDHKGTRAINSQECLTPPSLHKQDPATIALNVSNIVTSKTKRALSIEAGLEMIALGFMICSMVCLTLWHLFQPFGLILSSQEWLEVSRNGWPCQKFLDEVWICISLIVLVDYWTLLSCVDQMEPQQFEDISHKLQLIHKSMKNVMEIVFAISPLLALSTHVWDMKSIHSTYLLRVSDASVFSYSLLTTYKIFLALGNNCLSILIKLEDCVLEAIFDISEGKSTESVVDALHCQVEALHKDLVNNENALKWFHLFSPALSAPLTPPVTAPCPTALAGLFIHSGITLLFI